MVCLLNAIPRTAVRSGQTVLRIYPRGSSSTSPGTSLPPPFDIRGTLKTDGVKVGNYAEVKHSFDQATVTAFAGICGDNNPLHIDPSFAATTMFKGPIVHGILVSSLFSTLFGRAIHGSVYVSQSLSFKKPVHVGSPVIARMQILEMEERRSGTLIKCSTTCTLAGGNGSSDGQVAVEGEAKVLLPKSAPGV